VPPIRAAQVIDPSDGLSLKIPQSDTLPSVVVTLNCPLKFTTPFGSEADQYKAPSGPVKIFWPPISTLETSRPAQQDTHALVGVYAVEILAMKDPTRPKPQLLPPGKTGAGVGKNLPFDHVMFRSM
jgi:hypothetical protein